jgi:hypothetical protein
MQKPFILQSDNLCMDIFGKKETSENKEKGYAKENGSDTEDNSFYGIIVDFAPGGIENEEPAPGQTYPNPIPILPPPTPNHLDSHIKDSRT